MGLIDFFIRFVLIRSSIYSATSVALMILIGLDLEKLNNPFLDDSIARFIMSNSMENNISTLKEAFLNSYDNNIIFYIFASGLFFINTDAFIKMITYYKEINMPYALNFFNPIKKFEWQEHSVKVSHDRFHDLRNNSIFYKNSIAIDLEKYENFKNEIIQYLNLSHQYEIKIIPHERKGVEVRFFILPDNYTLKDEAYKVGSINYGMASDGIYYIDLLKQTHLLCVGESGSGKSNFMHHLLKSIFINMKGIDTLKLIDLKGTELYRYRYFDDVEFIDDIDGVLSILESLKIEMNNRFEEMKTKDEVLYSGKFKFIFIDEIGTLGTHPNKKLRDEIFALMIELFQKGRAAKIIFFIFAQKIDSTNIPSNVLANIQTKVLMKTDSDFNINNTIGTKESLEKITRIDVDSFPRGRGIVKNGDDSEKVLVQIPLIDLEVGREIAE